MKQIIRTDILTKLKSYRTLGDKSYLLELLTFLKPLLGDVSDIAIYHANSYEMSLKSVIDYCLVNNKHLYQPVSYRHSRHMFLTKYDAMKTEIFEDSQFIPQNCYEWYNLDLILLPLIAVDKNGIRLGKGGGYYDATLAEIIHKKERPVLCGVGFDFQLVDQLPHDNWDIKLDYFVSEKQLIKF